MSGQQSRTQREGREKEGLSSLSLSPLPLYLSPQKLSKENRSDARWNSRQPQATRNPAVHPCTRSLETNTQHKEDGAVSLTHGQLTAPGMEKTHTEARVPLEITFQEGSSADIKGERNTIKVW